MKDIL